MSKVISIENAISTIKSGDTIGINSFFRFGNPVNLMQKLYERVIKKNDLSDLSLYLSSPCGNFDENYPSERFFSTDAVKKLVCGHFTSMPLASRRIAENKTA